MKPRLLDLLACPKCEGDFGLNVDIAAEDDDIVAGTLTCSTCGITYPIHDGIPRFVPADSYASSFGMQWNIFQTEQLDSVNGFGLSAQRFWSETGWSHEWIKDRWILDAGCGAGRFLDVLADHECDIVGVDLSNAVDAARASLASRPNVHLVQASIYDLPFRRASFDGCYCIGVIQHTPDPLRALRTLPRLVKEGGKFAVTIYERKRWTHLYSKYILRRRTTRLSDTRLLTMIRYAMPVLFPLTDILFRLPVAGRLFQFLIPVANYVETPQLSLRERYRWAIMDTFDMLSPAYDTPQRYDDVAAALNGAGVCDIRRTASQGLCLSGTVRPRVVSASWPDQARSTIE